MKVIENFEFSTRKGVAFSNQYNHLIYICKYLHFILFYYKFQEENKYPAFMFKIKSHFRHKSQQDFAWKHSKKQKLSPSPIERQKIQFLTKISEKATLTGENLHKVSKKIRLEQLASARNSIGNSASDRNIRFQKGDFQNEIKKYNLTINDLGIVLGQISKQVVQQAHKNRVLAQLVELSKNQIYSNHGLDKNLPCFRSPKDDKQPVLIIKSQIQKITNQKNKNNNQNKKYLQDIQNQRKLRILYENYFSALQKQIRRHQIIYSQQLAKSLQNKFLFMMTSSNDVVSNGHVLALKKDDEKQNQKDLMRNSFMCLPKAKKESLLLDNQSDSRRKSSKCIGKKAAAKKLVKIMNFIATSKALESSELQLYEQDQIYERERHRVYSSFRTQKDVDHSFSHGGSGKSILKKKRQNTKSSKYNPRSGRIISIKFIQDINIYYESNFDEVVYELFRLYQSLGINIFARNDQLTTSRQFEDFFHFDEDLLINQSERRLEYIRKNEEKMKKFNQLLEKKINLVDENIIETQNIMGEMQKLILKDQLKYYEEEVETSQNDSEQNRLEYQEIADLLSVNSTHFNSEVEIQILVGKILIAQKQCQQLNIEKEQADSIKSICSSSNQLSFLTRINQKQNMLMTFPSFIENPKGTYAKKIMKTEGDQRKFRQLINKNDDEQLSKTSNFNKTSRSIFENGMKSLDNIFDNLKTCQSYQRAFERVEFQKEYSKEISKKKRVMFRRDAKVLTSTVE